MICPRCGFNGSEGARYCGNCGSTMPNHSIPSLKICYNCGSTNHGQSMFCRDCGNALPDRPASFTTCASTTNTTFGEKAEPLTTRTHTSDYGSRRLEKPEPCERKVEPPSNNPYSMYSCPRCGAIQTRGQTVYLYGSSEVMCSSCGAVLRSGDEMDGCFPPSREYQERNNEPYWKG